MPHSVQSVCYSQGMEENSNPTTYTIAVPTEGTATVQVHATGCRHTTMGHRLETLGTITGTTATEAAAAYRSRNEGITTRISPCAR